METFTVDNASTIPHHAPAYSSILQILMVRRLLSIPPSPPAILYCSPLTPLLDVVRRTLLSRAKSFTIVSPVFLNLSPVFAFA